MLAFQRRFRLLASAIVTLALLGCQGVSTGLFGSNISPDALSTAKGPKRVSPDSGMSLLYVSSTHGYVYVFTYPGGQLQDDFTPLTTIHGMCSDASGDIFVLGFNGSGYILEYAHGSSTPTSMINTGAGDQPSSCASDPTTGNLAVLEGAVDLQVFVYADAQGYPTVYQVPNMYRLSSCTYDTEGNLFVGGKNVSSQMAELPSGSGQFHDLTLDRKIGAPRTLQWVGSNLTIASSDKIYRASVSGSTVTILGETHASNGRPTSWIDGSRLIEVYSGRLNRVGFWKYPRGGKPVGIIKQVDQNFRGLTGIAISQ